MRNFEFKNPILKFKEGRKIVKASGGTLFWMGRMGDWYSGTRNGNTYINPTLITPEKIVPLRDGRTIAKINGKWYDLNGLLITKFVSHNPTPKPAASSVPADGMYFEEKGADGKIRKGRYLNGQKLYMTDELLRGNTSTAAPPANTGTDRRRPKFVSKLGDLNLTAEEKAFLEGQGVNVNDAMLMQNFILKNAANADLGARKGAGVADGYFGDKSFEAFQALRRSGAFAPKVDAQETPAPVVEQPVDAPDFGYATNQDYSNGSQFKGLGFNNYQGLLLYAQNSQDLFAKDLRQRFGDRLTDLNYVESQLGVSGKYRGGNAGDFGDIARSMQAWKTGVNNEFDRRRADYAQARLAERTGANGTVYSSPEMMKKFDVKVSPQIKYGTPQSTKLDFSNMKFDNIFTGAQTMGNVLTTTPENNWMKYALQTGYLS